MAQDTQVYQDVKEVLVKHTEQFKAAGIKTIEVYFDGSGDSGGMDSDSPVYLGEDGGIVNDFDPPKEVSDAIERLDEGDGYDGDGGGLEVSFDVASGTLTVKSYSYVTDRDYAADFEV